MPKKRKKRSEATFLVLECPLCATADSDSTVTFDAPGELTLHLTKGHTVAQLAAEIMRAALDRARSVSKCSHNGKSCI